MLRNKKIIILAAIAALIVAAVPAHRALGDGLFSISDLAAKAVNSIVFGVVYVMAILFGLVIAVEVWFINLIIQLSGGIVQTPAVQIGYSVMLSIANLGFVLGIIVIGIATILRSQTYGIKQILWKLVFMAILVNFGLVIGAVFINFANGLTTTFINAGFSKGFAQSMATIFQPQQLLEPAPTTSDVASAAEGTYGTVLTLIISLIFALITFVAIVIVLGTLAVMLAIRYVYLIVLLILLPFAWLCWVFPALRGNFEKWWHNFIRWTIFPPIVVFFLYLVVVMGNTASYRQTISAPPAGERYDLTGNVGSAITSFLGGAFNKVIPVILGDFVLLGLSVGGLIAANSLGIKGASAGISAVKSASGAVTGYVGKQAKKGARLGYQKLGGEKLEKGLREGAISKQLRKIPVVGGAAGWVMGRGEREAALGLGKITHNEQMVEDAKGRFRGKTWEETEQLLKSGNLNTEQTFAAIQKGVSEGKINNDTMIGSVKAGDYMNDLDRIKRFRQEKTSDDYDKLTMSTINSRSSEKALSSDEGKAAEQRAEEVRKESYERNRNEAMSQGYSPEEAEEQAKTAAENEKDEYLKKNGPKARATNDVKDENGNTIIKAGELVSAIKLLEASQREFLEKFSKADASKINSNQLFGPQAFVADRLAETERRIRNIAQYAPQIVPNLVKGMKSPALKAFDQSYSKVLRQLHIQYQDKVKSLAGDATGKLEDAQRILSRIKKAVKGYNRTVDTVFGSAEAGKKEEAAEKEKGGGGAPAGGTTGGKA